MQVEQDQKRREYGGNNNAVELRWSQMAAVADDGDGLISWADWLAYWASGTVEQGTPCGA